MKALIRLRRAHQSDGAKGGVEDVQKLVSQEARAVTGCFRTTNTDAHAMESDLPPAVALLENRGGLDRDFSVCRRVIRPKELRVPHPRLRCG